MAAQVVDFVGDPVGDRDELIGWDADRQQDGDEGDDDHHFRQRIAGTGEFSSVVPMSGESVGEDWHRHKYQK